MAATLNGIIVTEAGIVFGAGRDNQIRAWDSDTGKQLWSSRFGGNFVGSPVMYEMDGRQYLLVPAAGTAGAAVARYPPHPEQLRRWAGSLTRCRRSCRRGKFSAAAAATVFSHGREPVGYS